MKDQDVSTLSMTAACHGHDVVEETSSCLKKDVSTPTVIGSKNVIPTGTQLCRTPAASEHAEEVHCRAAETPKRWLEDEESRDCDIAMRLPLNSVEAGIKTLEAK